MHMTSTTATKQPRISLPSDQEASGRTLGDEELSRLAEVIRSGRLNSTKGSFVKALEESFAKTLGAKHALACASGTAAIHVAVAALDPNPGEEIITTSITDMGALTPILYQGAIPVFAEVDPRTCNVTAETIEPCLSDRTRAIIVTHLFGNPCDMEGILRLSSKRGIPVIEDCAQAFLAQFDGRYVGTIGAIGCFSMQQGKHMTSGEGGLLITDDDQLARRMFLFVNKAWGYGDANPDHYFLALNYRLSELQGAVALAQLGKLHEMVEHRISAAQRLTARLHGEPGIHTPWTPSKATHTYWKYCLRVDDRIIKGGAVALGAALKEKGIAAAPRYIQKPAFMCEIFQKQKTFGNSRFPFTLARPEIVDYSPSRFPKTYEALEQVLVLPWNERFTGDIVDRVATSIHEAVHQLLS
jgi:perosamine synthetase